MMYRWWYGSWSLVKVGLPKLLHCKLLFFLSSCAFTMEANGEVQPTFRKWRRAVEAYSTSWRGEYLNYLEFFCGENLFLLSIYLLMQSFFISVWIHAYFVFTLVMIMPHYLFCCSNCFNFDIGSFLFVWLGYLFCFVLVFGQFQIDY